jgi:hypothetical protein
VEETMPKKIKETEQPEVGAEGTPVVETESVPVVEAPQEITPDGRLAMRQEQFAERTEGWPKRPVVEITHTLWEKGDGHTWILDEVDPGLYRSHQVDHLLK